jgi:hypothetical protein
MQALQALTRRSGRETPLKGSLPARSCLFEACLISLELEAASVKIARKFARNFSCLTVCLNLPHAEMPQA